MATNLKDIAKRLNISVSTVSRAVNGKDRVDPETRKRVLDMVDELNYKPNEVARNLKTNTATTIGVVLPDLTNFFFASVFKGIEEVARKNGYTLLLSSTSEDPAFESEYTDIFLQKKVAGLIVATLNPKVTFYKEYSARGIPVVFFDNKPKISENFDFVSIDNEKAGYQLAEYIISLGHRNVAVIGSPLWEETAAERLDGFKRAFEDKGLQIKDEWIYIGKNSQAEEGYKFVKGLLKSKEKIHAVIAVNNLMIYGAIKAIYEHGLKIPQDISVAGFDTTDLTGILRPQITCIQQPTMEIGKIACDMLLKKINKEIGDVYQKVLLEPTLVANESCARRFEKE
jgi:LacI family transcriptional regulator